MKRSRFLALGALSLSLVVLLAACGSEGGDTDTDAADQPQAGGEETAATDCSVENLPLYEEGQLTIATDKPAFPPWFDNNDPTNGKGFESAVAYAVAEEMGFSRDQVEWVVEPFNKSYAPGPKDYDFDINQISITPKREEAVDFSEGYYDVNQALITLEGSELANARSLTDLKDAKLGAQVGTTSFAYIETYIEPTQQPFTYDNTNDAKSALRANQIDGIVVDLPTAFYITAVEIPGSVVAGQFSTQGASPEQFGLLFESGNPLVECVNQAIQTLKDDGTLASIQDEWLSQAVDAPVIE